MDEIALAAGVGKGTLFRRFGDRTSLLRELYRRRLAPLREAILSGPPPLGPSAPARRRIPALLVAIAKFKLDNAALMTSLESAPGNAAPLQSSPWYEDVHSLLRDLLANEGTRYPSWDAHILLGAVRADLVHHVATTEGMNEQDIAERLEALAGKILGA